MSKENRRALKILIEQAKGLEKTMDEILNNNANKIGFNYSSCNEFAAHYQSLVEESKNTLAYQEYMILMM